MLIEMLQLQCGINAQVHVDWPSQRYPWHLAIITEASEGIEHLSFKWWKKGTINLEQAQLELVDVWHFGMSLILQQVGDIHQAADFIMMETDLYSGRDNIDPILSFTEIIGTAASAKDFSILQFCDLLSSLNFDWSDLYLWYMGKNTLNLFRQSNGYKTGEYIKIWHGKEDNEHLAEILKESVVQPGLLDEVYKKLAFIYPNKEETAH